MQNLKHVVTSAAEAEVSALFHNAKTTIPLRRILIALGHPQPPTPIKVDNTTATSFVHNNITQKRSKSWDMRHHWLRDPPTKQQIMAYWDKGPNNWGDYFTKTHTTAYHRTQRPNYIKDKSTNPPTKLDFKDAFIQTDMLGSNNQLPIHHRSHPSS